MSAARLCNACNREVPYAEELFDKRIEFRNQRSLARYRTYKIAQYCRNCVDNERPVADVNTSQGSLL